MPRKGSQRARGRAAAPALATALAGLTLSLAVGSAGAATGVRGAPDPARNHADLANRCLRLASAPGDRPLAVVTRGYRADRPGGERLAAFYLKPTDLGTYLLQDQVGTLLALRRGGGVERAATGPGPRAEWTIRRRPGRTFELSPLTGSGRLAVAPGSGELVLSPPGEPARRDRFRFLPTVGCAAFAEARVGASGRSRPTRRDGTIHGFADAHLHVTANLRAGGMVISGAPFHRYGVAAALGRDEHVHGPNGGLDLTGNLLRDGTPLATHDTAGWPTFGGWPVHDTLTHQQAYYVWLERAWRAGLRLLVAQAVEDEALCNLEPRRSHSCDETATVKLAISRLRDLERYVDAQHGGRGRGWFRLVERPRQARRVMRRGKLAVVIGMETSSPFGCGERFGAVQCTREEIDRVLEELHGLGVRSAFVAHWVDNGYAGAALQGGAKGDFIDLFQLTSTGGTFSTEPCGEAGEAEGTCNSKGLTDLGRYLIDRLMDKGMLIEADHLSQRAREAVLEIAERRSYPLVSSHTGTGGEWTPSQLRRLYRVGGIASATPEAAPGLIERLLRLRRDAGGGRRAVALGSDTGGFASLPGPRSGGERRLRYPFRSFDDRVRFKRQRTGARTFDLNEDGVAHYGLFADLIADVEGHRRGPRALRTLFSSAEAYLRTWERARARSRP